MVLMWFFRIIGGIESIGYALDVARLFISSVTSSELVFLKVNFLLKGKNSLIFLIDGCSLYFSMADLTGSR